MSLIEIFTGSCRLCEGAVQVVESAIAGTGHEVMVLHIDGPEAKAYGLTSVPSVVKDGQLIFTRLPTLEEAEASLR